MGRSTEWGHPGNLAADTGTVGAAEVLLSDGSQVMALYAPPGGGWGQLPRVFGLKPVEAYE
ncbi:MAG: hypothetical protein SF028_11845 [Candidatus Sumerlaeia bacterium]|nr:hypothetical protein [Candidatus Sumerlaeia bacterium]